MIKINDSFAEGELDVNSVVRNFRTTAQDGKNYSTKTNMGLTVIQGKHPRKDEVTVAKNYLSENELNILNRITSAYLEFAELQARTLPECRREYGTRAVQRRYAERIFG